MSLWWVSAARLTRFTALIDDASGVAIVMSEPYVAAPGALEIVGRRPGLRRRGVGDARRAARVQDLARPVHDRGAVDDAARAADRGPGLVVHVEEERLVLGRADREDLAVRHQEAEGVLELVD